jgi:tRNA-Thr(GGU) m(6)t(6)A37 methyltransferase TsaA
MEIVLEPIGIIYTPFKSKEEVPRQGTFNEEINGTIELDKRYMTGLKDLKAFSHLILIFHFHKADTYKLLLTPRDDNVVRGVFATRAPARPNHIGMTIVKLIDIDKNILTIGNVDMLNGTPLLDIKPYIPDLDSISNARIGWIQDRFKKQT